MMEAEESHPTTGTKKGATEDMVAKETVAPKRPSIQLDEQGASDNVDQHAEKRDAEEKSFGQLRTPKHANKTAGSGSRDDSSPTSSGRGFSRETEQPNKKITPERKDASAPSYNKGSYSMGGAPPQHPGYPPQDKMPYGRYHGASGEGYGQFRAQTQQDAAYYDPRIRMMQQQAGSNPQTISPGGSSMPSAYRTTGGYNTAAYAMQGRYQQEAYNQGDYAGRYPPTAGYRGTGQYGYSQDARYVYGDGSRHPQYGQGIPYQGGQHPSQGRPPHPQYSSQHPARPTIAPHEHDPRYANVSGFTRAVSNSFDRSTKSSDNALPRTGVTVTGQPGKPDQGHSIRTEYYPQPEHATQNDPDGNASVPDDDSWRQLNQVASVDNSTIRAHMDQLERKKTAMESKDEGIRPSLSNSSSLTNSPTEGHEATAEGKQHSIPSKMAPLDSLSSVASAQEPMDTAGSKDDKSEKPGVSSPVSSSGSLDLMKCHSGSSGLLTGFPTTHGRSMSGSSFLLDSKRLRDERGDAETKLASVEDGRRQAPTGGPPTKKIRIDDKGDDKRKSVQRDGKSSSLPVDSSPPPDADKTAAASRAVSHPPAARFSTSPGAYVGSSGYLDRAPSYTYSIDSVPSKEYAYPPLPPRPGSSSSSTITPAGGTAMQIDGPVSSMDGHQRGDSLVGALPSWDTIHAQDSFGAGSLSGGNFSFSQDYPMLSATGSNLGQPTAQAPASANTGQSQAPTNQQGAQQQGRHHGPPTSLAESRNQSFEGGQYHGAIARTESMDLSYSGGATQPAAATQYQQEGYRQSGSFPPHALSWGTTSSSTSTQPTHPAASFQAAHMAQYSRPPGAPRTRFAGTMRNYAEDRTSPPGPRGAASTFQPPPEFVAPLSQLRRPPPQAVYIMSSDGRKSNDPSLVSKSAAGGVYGWTQEQDDRLTDLMKKYKNPRDWEPIAKEHGFEKSAKECHERWIRYLKPGVRKGQWTDHEDAIVVEAVSSSAEQPFTRWSDLAQKLPGRVGKQIRDRWVNHLNPNINHMPFSKEDDLLLWEGHKQVGKRWVEISTKFFNSSRSENHIKNRWYSASFKKFIANEFGPNAHSGGGKAKSTKAKKSSTPKGSATSKATNSTSV